MDASSPTAEATSPAESADILVSHQAAPAAQGGMSGTMMSLAPLFLVFGIIYVLIIMPQQKEQKKHQELLAALKKGDRVVTSAGMHGTIFEVRGDELVVEVADRVRITFDRSAVQRISTEGASAKVGG